jgi:hypothetical protein
MGEIVNLKRARKAKARDDAAAEAAANRAKYGMTKAERAQIRDDAARRAKTLDHAKRDDQ